MYLSEWHIRKSEMLSHKILNEYSLHQRVFDLFPNCNARSFLYYPRYLSGSSVSLLVQSDMPPTYPGYGCLETKEVPSSFFHHAKYLFSVRFCPVVQSLENGVIPLKQDKDVIDWLLKRESTYGVSFCPNTLVKTGCGFMSMSQKGNLGRIRIDYVEMMGILTVNDFDAFFTTVRKGIGRSKGFGLGMFQLRPIR